MVAQVESHSPHRNVSGWTFWGVVGVNYPIRQKSKVSPGNERRRSDTLAPRIGFAWHSGSKNYATICSMQADHTIHREAVSARTLRLGTIRSRRIRSRPSSQRAPFRPAPFSREHVAARSRCANARTFRGRQDQPHSKRWKWRPTLWLFVNTQFSMSRPPRLRASRATPSMSGLGTVLVIKLSLISRDESWTTKPTRCVPSTTPRPAGASVAQRNTEIPRPTGPNSHPRPQLNRSPDDDRKRFLLANQQFKSGPRAAPLVYGYRPVLAETFVDTDRFKGTCYNAANWSYLGETQRRGKLDVEFKSPLSRKSIWVFPLAKNFRATLSG